MIDPTGESSAWAAPHWLWALAAMPVIALMLLAILLAVVIF